MANLEGRVVKILKQGASEAVGTGILVSEELIVTCAHVIAQALGDKTLAQSPVSRLVGKPIAVELGALTATREACQTRIEDWHPVRSNGAEHELEDIAVLKLVKRSSLGDSHSIWMNPSVNAMGAFFGFGQYSNWVECKATGHGEHWMHLKCFDHEAEPGYSGAPVFNAQHTRIMGMLVARDAGQHTAKMIPSTLLSRLLPVNIANARAVNLADVLSRLLDRSTHYDTIRDKQGRAHACYIIEGCIADAPGYLAERVAMGDHLECHGLENLAIDPQFGPLHLKFSPRRSFVDALEGQCTESLVRWLATPQTKTVQLRPEHGVDLIEHVQWILAGFDELRARVACIEGRIVVMVLLHREAHGALKRWWLRRWLANRKDNGAAYLPPLGHVDPVHLVSYVEDLPTLARQHFGQRFRLERVSSELNELSLRVEDPQRYLTIAKPLRDLLESHYQDPT